MPPCTTGTEETHPCQPNEGRRKRRDFGFCGTAELILWETQYIPAIPSRRVNSVSNGILIRFHGRDAGEQLVTPGLRKYCDRMKSRYPETRDGTRWARRAGNKKRSDRREREKDRAGREEGASIYEKQISKGMSEDLTEYRDPECPLLVVSIVRCRGKARNCGAISVGKPTPRIRCQRLTLN